MSHVANLAAVSRIEQIVAILTLDYCDREFGVAPCSATGGKCYKTKSTCKYPSAYVTTTGRDYKFCLNSAPLPFPGEPVRPYLKKPPSYNPTKIDPRNSIVRNAKVAMEFFDEPDTDIGMDPYASSRAGYPDNHVDSFWATLFARNKYYLGRKVVQKAGFVPDVEAEYKAKLFVLDGIAGPNDGVMKIVMKDPLKIADRRQIPIATRGKLNADVDSSVTTFTVSEDGYAASDFTSEYPASGYIRIGKEVCYYAARSASSPLQFTGVVRGQNNTYFKTDAESHKAGDKIQNCYYKINTHAADIIDDMLENHLDIASAYINSASFSDTKDNWLGGFLFTGIITKPMDTSKAIEELQVESMTYLFWDEDDQKFHLKTLHPPKPTDYVKELTDEANIKKVEKDNNEASRMSRIVVHYDKHPTKEAGKSDSYNRNNVDWDIVSEGPTEYGQEAIKTIYSRWIPASGSAMVDTICTRLHRRFEDPAAKLKLELEIKDSGIRTAEIVNITSMAVVGADGQPLQSHSWEVVQKRQVSLGVFEAEVLDTAWGKRYAFWAPPGTPTYPSASAVQRKYGFFGDSDGRVNSGEEEGHAFF